MQHFLLSQKAILHEVAVFLPLASTLMKRKSVLKRRNYIIFF